MTPLVEGGISVADQRPPVVVLDDLSAGHRDAITAPLEVCNLGDRDGLAAVFAKHKPRSVIHFAAKCYVGESVEDPAKYYEHNVMYTWTLLQAMRESGCRNIVFSSSCATYGDPVEMPMTDESVYVHNRIAFDTTGAIRSLSSQPEEVVLAFPTRRDKTTAATLPPGATKHVATTVTGEQRGGLAATPDHSAATQCRTGGEIMARAYAYANYTATYGPQHLDASCSGRTRPGHATWSTVTGAIYRYAGYQTLEAYDAAVQAGKVVGDVKQADGVASCANGVDCSGFVSQVWGASYHSTHWMHNITTVIDRAQLIPGDALHKIGHVRLVEKNLGSDGVLVVESTTGNYDRVIARWMSWGSNNAYKTVRYHQHCGYYGEPPMPEPEPEPEPKPKPAPCPSPHARKVLADPVVQKAFDDAWRKSKEGTPDEHEESFWVVQRKLRHTGKVTYRTDIVWDKPGTTARSGGSNKPRVSRGRIVMHAHTHPGPGAEHKQNDAYANDQASPADITNQNTTGVPSAVRYGRGADPKNTKTFLVPLPDKKLLLTPRELNWKCPKPPAPPPGAPPPVKPTPCNDCARTTGDPHLETHDSLSFDLQAAGEFVAVNIDGKPRLQVRLEPIGSSRRISTTTAVAMKVGLARVSIRPGLGLYVEGHPVNLHPSAQALAGQQALVMVGNQLTTLEAEKFALAGGGQVQRFGSDYLIDWPDKSRLWVQVQPRSLDIFF
ncbi:MAG: NAD-dependent epimerase/dehydratase family protein, partial [Nannocystaceae bacterium]